MFHASVLDGLAQINDKSVDTVVTSPPYWQQRDYGHPEQLGQEATADEYVENMLKVTAELARVLKNCGSFWLNIDDKYWNNKLMSIPWRLAIAMQDRQGWVLRCDVIWNKPGPMPAGGKSGRPTRSHEYLFFFTKHPSDYYYDRDEMLEPHTRKWALDCIKKFQDNPVPRPEYNAFNKEERHRKGQSGITRAQYGAMMNPKGKCKRSVWTVNTNKFRGAHYAVFPIELIKPCILSCCPPNGVVLDPFGGAGNSGVCAIENGRNFLGIELVESSFQLANKNLTESNDLYEQKQSVSQVVRDGLSAELDDGASAEGDAQSQIKTEVESAETKIQPPLAA